MYYGVMEIISRFIDMCFFRAAPSDVPASPSLLTITLLSYFVLSVLINLLDLAWGVGILVSFIDVLIMLVVVKLLLQFRGFQSRYQQTITALAGTGVCMSIVAYPVMWRFYQLEPEQQATSFSMLLMVAVLLWSLMIMAQILRQSLEVRAGTAMMITIAYIAITIVVTGLVMSGVA